MIGLVLGLQEQVRREFRLSRWNEYFYRFEHGKHGCPSCKRYFQLLDTCPLRIPHDQQHEGVGK